MNVNLKDERCKKLIGKIEDSALEQFPLELLENRELIEMSYVFGLWKNPEFYSDFADINPSTDLITFDGKFFYDIGFSIFQLGVKVIDDASLHSFLKDDKAMLEKFNKKGGYKVFQSLKKILSTDNMESYYDALVKHNILLNLYSKGFAIVDNLEKLNKMTTSQIYAFFEYHLDNTFLNRGSGVEIVDMTIDDEWIEECDSGAAKGLSYADFAPIMNYHTLGIHRSNVTVFAGYSGTGKAQPLTSKIMTPSGYVNMGDLKLGDEVYGEDGKIHNVIGIFPQGMKDVYKVKFNDGSETITCDEHLWNVQDNNGRRSGKFKTKSLREIMDEGVSYGNGYKRNTKFIPMTKPLEMEAKELLIQPYLLGMLIGDGGLTSTSVMLTFNPKEKDLITKCEKLVNELGYEFISSGQIEDKTFRITKGRTGGESELIKELKSLGLMGKNSKGKFIPKEYLFNSIENRLELLRGLIDSDGEVTSNQYTYSTVSPKLAEDIKFLVNSLGGTCKISERQTYFTHKGIRKEGQPSFRLYIKLPHELLGFSSDKHKAKYKKGQREAYRCMESFEYLGKMETQCIKVSNPTSLYLTDDMIVTHNTSFAIHTYLLSILRAGEKLAIVANEMNINAWKHILVATVLSQEFKYYGLPRKKMKTGGFSAEQKAMIKKAQEYINTEYKGRLKFVKIFDYSIEDVKRVFKKLAKQGFSYGLYDTFKAEDASSGNVTGELIEASKQLLQVAEKEDIGIIITMQLAIHTENQRFLTGNTLSNSKGVKEVVSELILMRRLWEDEYTGEAYDVKPWRHKRDPVTGKIIKGKDYFDTDKEKKYRIVFIDKTRNDDDGIALLFEFNGAWNDWKEIGYCTVSHKNRQ